MPFHLSHEALIANSEFAERMAELVKDFVEYEKASSTAESLEKELALQAEETGR